MDNNERLVFSMLNLVGRQVHVVKLNGCELTGVFCSTKPPASSEGEKITFEPEAQDEDGFIIRYVSHVNGQKPSIHFEYKDKMKIGWNEVESVLAVNSGGPIGWAMDGSDESMKLPSEAKASSVQTDSSISSAPGTMRKERGALQAVGQEWLSTQAPAEKGDDNKNWDQFKANEEKFGIKSSYREEIYTTELKKENFTADQIAWANRIEQEIEGSSSSNPHVQDERGHQTKDSKNSDEEAKYSAVVGSGDFKAPPATNSSSRPGYSAGAPSVQTGKGPTWAAVAKAGTKPNSSAVSTGISSAPDNASAAPLPDGKAIDKQANGAGPKRPAPEKATVPSSQAKDKKRQDEIREFKEFSQSYSFPKPASKAENGSKTPEQAKNTTKEVSEPSENGKAKKALNPNAKNFNPSASAFVPSQQPPPAVPVGMMSDQFPRPMRYQQMNPQQFNAIPAGTQPMAYTLPPGGGGYVVQGGAPGPMGGYMPSFHYSAPRMMYTSYGPPPHVYPQMMPMHQYGTVPPPPPMTQGLQPHLPRGTPHPQPPSGSSSSSPTQQQ